MNRKSLTTAVIAGIAGVAGIANMASAVNLNPDGLGQVLLFPYYTVNGGQQTLISVVNTTDMGKAVKVRFLEGYNSREVLDFNLFMSAYDVWTANVFSLSDAGLSGTGAGIFSADNSCTAPAFTMGPLGNGYGYQKFLNYAYTGNYSDTGPTGDSRTREGHFEMINMGDIEPASDLGAAITHDSTGVPPDCAHAESLAEAYTFPANTGGLFGSASIVDVANGVFYAYNADALDGFSQTSLFTQTGFLTPSLAQVNDSGAPTSVTSYVFNNGQLVTSSYTSQPIDAVSSVFMASDVYNEYVAAADGSVGTDWVVTFPTKRFYVDKDTYPGNTTAPFEEAFGESEDGLSCTVVGINIFDREEQTSTPSGCGFSPCPPGQPPSSLCHETNVISFLPGGTGTDILSSGLTSNINPIADAGWVDLDLTGNGHDLSPSAYNNNIFHGLPVTGFEAVKYVFGNNNGALANYSGVYRHRISRSCDNGRQGPCS